MIIPVRNGAAYLEQAIESVRAQTHPAREIVVVDDGSTDSTPEIARRLGPLIRFDRQPPAGIGAARNRAVRISGQPLLAFLDADDVWHPDKLQLQAAVLADEPAMDLVFCHADEFLDGAAAHAEGAGVRTARTDVPGIIPSCLLVRRTAFDRVGPFAEDMAVAEFADWYARAIELRLGMRVVTDRLVRRRIHGENHGLRQAEQRLQYVRVLKAALDRRRSQARGG